MGVPVLSMYGSTGTTVCDDNGGSVYLLFFGLLCFVHIEHLLLLIQFLQSSIAEKAGHTKDTWNTCRLLSCQTTNVEDVVTAK